MATTHYLFRTYRLDPAARELHKEGELVSLPISALDCLIHLVENRERAVGRDELIAAVWERVDVADTLLAQTILRIRRALGDSGSEGAIRTIARFGYRWVEETRVEVTADTDPATLELESAPPPADLGDDARPNPPTVRTKPMASAPRRDRRRIGIAVTALALLAVAFLLFGLGEKKSTLPVPATNDQAISASMPALVLPAEVPESADWSWLRLGLMDLIGNRLRQSGLPTAPSETVLTLLGSPPLIATLAANEAAANAWRIQPTAEFRDGQWRIRLRAEWPGVPSLETEARDPDVLKAARSVADLLGIRLGHAPRASADQRSLALEELLQRTRAAILSDQFDLALHLIDEAPEALQRSPDIALRLAQIDLGRGNNQQAENRLQALLDQVSVDVDRVLRGRILVTLGSAQFRRRELATSEQTHDEAIRVLDGAGDPIGLAAAYAGRAAVVAQDEKLEQAAADLGRARVEMEAGGDALGLAQVDMNLALVQNSSYRPNQALPMLRSAESRIAMLGAREELAYARYSLVGVLMQLLEYRDAQKMMDQLWPPEAHTGNDWIRGQLILERANLLRATGHLTDAEALLAPILAATPTSGGDANQAHARALASLIAVARGNCAEATLLAVAALTPSLEYDQPDLYLETWLGRLDCQRRNGDVGGAAEATMALRRWVDGHANPWRETHALLAESEQATAERRTDSALDRYAQAFAHAQRLAIPDTLVSVAFPYALALIDAGQLDRASAVVGSVAAWADQDWRAAWAQAQLYRAQQRTPAWQAAAERALQLAGETVIPVAIR